MKRRLQTRHTGQSARTWRLGKPYAPTVLYLPGRFLVLISVRGCSTQGHSAIGGIRQIEKKNLLTSLGIEPVTLQETRLEI
jgi:hypothetical protein